MPLLNYTTTIQAVKTVGEIQNILAKHGAKSILIDYDDAGHIEALAFCVGTMHGDISIRLPILPDSVLKVLQRQAIPIRYKNRPQAIRIAWRIVKDWTEAQMAILETEMVQMEQIFLPYIIGETGKTIYESFLENRLQLMQPNPKEDETQDSQEEVNP